jgi:hypothetical protein
LTATVKSRKGVYEKAAESVYISVDAISAKKQKAERNPPVKTAEEVVPAVAEKRVRERVTSYVGTVVHQGHKYTLTAGGYGMLMSFIVAYLMTNKLWMKRLCVFSDGERSLTNELFRWLGRHGAVIFMLDWYHLEHKCGELLSLVIKGKERRNVHWRKLTHYLWHGDVHGALDYLAAMPADEIKNLGALNPLTGYLRNHQKRIPCYALRLALGLLNSSNAVEKANDLVMAQRQKHHGMSWSAAGSLHLSVISTVLQNQQHHQWLEEGKIPLTLTEKFPKAA